MSKPQILFLYNVSKQDIFKSVNVMLQLLYRVVISNDLNM